MQGIPAALCEEAERAAWRGRQWDWLRGYCISAVLQREISASGTEDWRWSILAMTWLVAFNAKNGVRGRGRR